MWHRTADGRHYNDSTQPNYDELLDEGLNLLMGLPFKWSGVTVKVSSHLVDQIIRRWGTSSSEPAVIKIRSKLADYASENKRNADLHEVYVQLADSVSDIEFWKAVQKRDI